MSKSILSHPEAELLLGTTECCLFSLDKAIQEGTPETLADLYRWTHQLRPLAARSLGVIGSREPVRVCGITAPSASVAICRLGQRALYLACIVVPGGPDLCGPFDVNPLEGHADLIGRYLRHFFRDVDDGWLRAEMVIEIQNLNSAVIGGGSVSFFMSFPSIAVEWLEVCEMMPAGWVKMDAKARLAWIEKTERFRKSDGVEYSVPISYKILEKAYNVVHNTFLKWIDEGTIRTCGNAGRFVRVAIPDLPPKIRREYMRESL